MFLYAKIRAVKWPDIASLRGEVEVAADADAVVIRGCVGKKENACQVLSGT